jgi:hypothetical protein
MTRNEPIASIGRFAYEGWVELELLVLNAAPLAYEGWAC